MLRSISGAEKLGSENSPVKNCRSALKLERKGGISSEYSQDQPKADSARYLCGFCENRNHVEIIEIKILKRGEQKYLQSEGKPAASFKRSPIFTLHLGYPYVCFWRPVKLKPCRSTA